MKEIRHCHFFLGGGLFVAVLDQEQSEPAHAGSMTKLKLADFPFVSLISYVHYDLVFLLLLRNSIDIYFKSDMRDHLQLRIFFRNCTVDRDEIRRLLRAKLITGRSGKGVSRQINVPLWQQHEDQIVSFIFRVGPNDQRRAVMDYVLLFKAATKLCGLKTISAEQLETFLNGTRSFIDKLDFYNEDVFPLGWLSESLEDESGKKSFGRTLAKAYGALLDLEEFLIMFDERPKKVGAPKKREVEKAIHLFLDFFSKYKSPLRRMEYEFLGEDKTGAVSTKFEMICNLASNSMIASRIDPTLKLATTFRVAKGSELIRARLGIGRNS